MMKLQKEPLWKKAKKKILGGNLLLSKRPEMFLPDYWPTYFKKAKGIDGKLDTLWSELIKALAGYKCEYCGKETTLNSHHIYSRSKKSTRWALNNGVCLCVAHHTFSSSFSAHKTPVEFTEWLNEYKGTEFIDSLRLEANSTKKWAKFEKELLLASLNDTLKEI